MDWQTHVVSDPAICHGKACIKGSRVLVSVILDNLADGESMNDIASTYQITADDVRAAIQYAAELAKQRVVPLPADVA